MRQGFTITRLNQKRVLKDDLGGQRFNLNEEVELFMRNFLWQQSQKTEKIKISFSTWKLWRKIKKCFEFISYSDKFLKKIPVYIYLLLTKNKQSKLQLLMWFSSEGGESKNRILFFKVLKEEEV